MAAQIYPTTDTPGAREAQVIYFIDLALVTFAQDKQDIYAKGLADLSSQTGGKAPRPAVRPTSRSGCSPRSRRRRSSSTVRDHTIMGMFAAPQHGGNYQKVGWQQIGFDDSLNFRAPFGAYDKA